MDELELTMAASAQHAAKGGRRPDGTPRPIGYFGFAVTVSDRDEIGRVRGVRVVATLKAGTQYCCGESLCHFGFRKTASAIRDAILGREGCISDDFEISEWVTVVEAGAVLTTNPDFGVSPVVSDDWSSTEGPYRPRGDVSSKLEDRPP